MTERTDPDARVVVRPATTFRLRRRRLSPKRQAELDRWIEEWSLSVDGPPLDWREVFGDLVDAPGWKGVVLDVGFGHGESTIAMATDQPGYGVVGVEVHDPGVVTVLDAIVNRPLPHVRVVHGDLLRFLPRLPARSLAGVRVFFPDPWTKKRRHHRRLVGPDVVAALTDRLAVGGFLHLATDIDDYADRMEASCAAEVRLIGGVVPRPDDRPLTRFERRGLDAGRHPVDLLYHRTT